MKNKIKLKNTLKKIFILMTVFIIIFFFILYLERKIYIYNYNKTIANIIDNVLVKYPNLTEEEIINILNNPQEININYFKYGIDIYNDSIIKNNDSLFIFINIIYLIFIIVIITFVFIKYEKEKDQDIKDITKYLNEINKRNYELDIDNLSEDELSILKNELVKITKILKENSYNLEKDKLELKTALEYISHQLKTPLTSILIMVDNIIEDKNMSKNKKEEFLLDIKREALNINFLVQSLLKLAKFDASTIAFTKEKVYLEEIINEVIKKVAYLSDLKNIKLIVKIDEKASIVGDKNWQIEAITNILKNCLEYSFVNSKIDLECGQNNVYSYIYITDYGKEIKKEELKHIFDRFYQGENKNNTNVGIGLELSKKIINKDNGIILVESTKEKTTFRIKYYNW